MVFLSATLAILGFLIGFQLSGVVPTAGRIVALAKRAGQVMRDKDLTDEDKEKEIQKSALAMMGGAVSIFLRVAFTLILTVLPVYLLSWVGLAAAGDVFSFLARIDVIIGATVVVGGGLWLWSKRPKKAATSNYSPMDRLVHRLAFAAPFVQATAADVEDGIFGSDIEGIEGTAPVFITSLPRAGTTIVLNALHELPGVATHLYRDMPFIMAPLFWSRMSAGFQKSSEMAERAHGDGIKVGFDSPEAFEEVIWRHFWPGHFRETEIGLWTKGDKNGEATQFFKDHFRKIISLRCGKNGRYVSKNNGNIARLDLLPQMFPDASIILPLRDPAEHAASLMRQHQNFLKQHAEDKFIKRYMKDIGHLEFGELHRPIAFEGFAELTNGTTPNDPDYWLGYWLAAMEHAAKRADRLIIVPETTLQDAPQRVMSRICDLTGLAAGDHDFTHHFRKITPRADRSQFSSDQLDRAMALYQNLCERQL